MSELWSVSGGPAPGGGPGAMREIDSDDIDELVCGHVRAARAALAAGVDGVECMFAYDTLVDGFMSAARNRRADGYGGSLEGRMRLAREILDALRSEIGDAPLLGVTVTASHAGLRRSSGVPRRALRRRLLRHRERQLRRPRPAHADAGLRARIRGSVRASGQGARPRTRSSSPRVGSRGRSSASRHSRREVATSSG